MTSKGQTDYWIGLTASLPIEMADTALNLSDVDIIRKDSVFDLSNDRQLKPMGGQPFGPTLNFRSGMTREGQPAVFWQDPNDVNILHIYPGSNNDNPYQPTPSSPVVKSAAGGALPLRTYYVRITFVDSSSGESTGSNTIVKIVVPANNLLTVVSPKLYFNKTSSGVTYSSYNVYVGPSEGGETLQNVSPIAIGTNWTEPGTTLTYAGASVPVINTLEQMGGYIVAFRYFKARTELTAVGDPLQIPTKYEDIVVQGVQALAWKLLGKEDQATASSNLYSMGLTSMVWDKNLFPDVDFMRPDSASHVNQQILGYSPPFF